MIVVGFLEGGDALAFEVARQAAGTGARVEMLGAAPPGPDGDTRLLELAAAGIGHATVIRRGDGATAATAADLLEPADLDLSLRYLPDVRSVVLVRPPGRLLATAVAGADWTGASLVVVGPLNGDALEVIGALPGTAAQPIVLDPPADADPDGTFAGFVAALASRLEAGEPPDTALRSTLAALAVDAV